MSVRKGLKYHSRIIESGNSHSLTQHPLSLTYSRHSHPADSARPKVFSISICSNFTLYGDIPFHRFSYVKKPEISKKNIYQAHQSCHFSIKYDFFSEMSLFSVFFSIDPRKKKYQPIHQPFAYNFPLFSTLSLNKYARWKFPK